MRDSTNTCRVIIVIIVIEGGGVERPIAHLLFTFSILKKKKKKKNFLFLLELTFTLASSHDLILQHVVLASVRLVSNTPPPWFKAEALLKPCLHRRRRRRSDMPGLSALWFQEFQPPKHRNWGQAARAVKDPPIQPFARPPANT